jgi:hypothetical protein
MPSVGPNSTTAELEAADKELSAALLGPLLNIERQLIVEDRREIRAELAKRADAKPGKPDAT